MLQKSDKPRGKFQSYVLTEVVYVSDATDVSADMEINKSEENSAEFMSGRLVACAKAWRQANKQHNGVKRVLKCGIRGLANLSQLS